MMTYVLLYTMRERAGDRKHRGGLGRGGLTNAMSRVQSVADGDEAIDRFDGLLSEW